MALSYRQLNELRCTTCFPSLHCPLQRISQLDEMNNTVLTVRLLYAHQIRFDLENIVINTMRQIFSPTNYLNSSSLFTARALNARSSTTCYSSSNRQDALLTNSMIAGPSCLQLADLCMCSYVSSGWKLCLIARQTLW